MFDHISNTIKYIVVVILSVPHEGWGADHFVLLINVGFVKQRVKVNIRAKKEDKHTHIHTQIYTIL